MSAADIFESIAWILLHQMDGYAFWIINEAVKSWQHFCETDLITSNRSSRWTDKQHVTDVTVLFRLTIARKPIHYQTNGNQMWSHVLTFIVNVTTDYYFFCFIFFSLFSSNGRSGDCLHSMRVNIFTFGSITTVLFVKCTLRFTRQASSCLSEKDFKKVNYIGYNSIRNLHFVNCIR